MKRKQQQGFILLQVMFVFAILVVIVVQLQYQQRLQLERTQYSLFLSQAQAYADSAEAIAQVGLAIDKRETPNDHLFELWNTQEGVFPLDEGSIIKIEINDLQGKFNVNWLSVNNEKREGALAGFGRLLDLIGQDRAIADELYQWLDPDSGIDFNYGDESPSYAPSFTEMADISELLLLKSVDHKVFAELKPYVVALPSNSLLNINTAPAEVIQSIAKFTNEAFAEEVVNDRGEEGFESVEEFTNHELFQVEQNKEEGRWLDNLSVSTQWFQLYTSVVLLGMDDDWVQTSIVYRDEQGDTTITHRDNSRFSAPEPKDRPQDDDDSILDDQDNNN